MNCTACGTPNEPAARFCASCGKPLAHQPPNAFAATALVAAVPPMQPQPQQPPHTSGPQFCAACGADLVNGQCDRCGGRQGVSAPAPQGGFHWVQLRIMIKCINCQRSSPLNRLDMDGRYYCYGCGRDQFFDADMWAERVLFIASGLGDAFWSMAGVFPPWSTHEPSNDFLEDHDEELGGDLTVVPHLLNKCKEIGRTTGGLTVEQGGMSMGSGGTRTRGVALEMSPGHPLCAQCKTPLVTQFPSPGVVTATCSRCGTHENYRAPQAAALVCKDFCGVIAPEHVEGREAARLMAQPGSALLATACPKCGSGLQLAAGSRITTCPYCKTTAVVPDQIASAGQQAPSRAEPLWLAFRSPSTVRTLIQESERNPTASDDEEEKEAPDSGRADRLREAQRLAAEAQTGRSRQTMSAMLAIIPIALVAGAFVVFRTGALDSVLHKEGKHEGHSGKDKPDPTPTTTKPSRSESVPLPSCVCAFGDGQSTPQITLSVNAPSSDGTRPWSLEIEKTSGFISEARTAKFPMQAGAVIPPSADAGAPSRMGIACDTGIFVLVGDKAATGWSSINGAWKWNTTLPSPMVDGADAGPTTIAGTDYAGGCTPLATRGGAASLTLANGRHVSLSLKDGKVR